MIKKILILSSLLLSINSNAQTMVGGWYPMFFNTFDQDTRDQIDSFITKANNGCVKSSELSYDQNELLKNQILNYIKSKENLAKSNLNLTINQQKNTDDDNTKYNHEQVVITVYSQKCNY
jgi:hypothetical protein